MYHITREEFHRLFNIMTGKGYALLTISHSNHLRIFLLVNFKRSQADLKECT